MEGVELLSNAPSFWQIASYIITVVIGGVGYKFYQVWISHKENTTSSDQTANQQLITNLSERIKKITDRVDELEKERRETHERELKRVQELEQANAKVRILTERMKHFEETIESLRSLLHMYQDKHGDINEET